MSTEKKPSSTDSNNPQKLTDKKKAEKEIEAVLESLSLKEGETRPPPRKPQGTNGSHNIINTNIYQVQIDAKDSNEAIVYRYDVTMTGKSARGGREVDLTKRSESSAVIAQRLDNCREAFNLIFEKFPNVFGQDKNSIFYDLQSILYTLHPLPVPPGQPVNLLIERSDENVQIPGNLASITMQIKNVREAAQTINIKDLSALINEETLARDRSVLNFIELAVNQYPMMNSAEFLTLKGSMVFFMDGTKHGLPELELDRGGTKYLASGVQKSAVLIEGFKNEKSDQNQRKIGLMLEAKHSPFHSVISLFECIQRHGNTSSLYEEFIRGKLDDRGLNQMNRAFKKMQLLVKYPTGSTRKIEFKSFDETTANSHIIQDLNTSVAIYFEEKYGRLRFEDAHLVKVKQGQASNFYPPEFLFIADNQVVTAEQMDAASKAAMIKACAIRPDMMENENKNAAAAIHLHNSDFSTRAGIKFSKETLKTDSRILRPPIVSYGERRQNRVDTREAAWRMAPFIEPGRSNNYAVYLLTSEGENRTILSENEMKTFIMEIDRFSTRYNMQIGTCSDSGVYTDKQVEECVKFCADNNIQLCLFITPENIKSCHSVMKMCEHRYNVITQDLTVKSARKMLTKSAQATLENYMAKTNIKVGGLNHSVQVEDPAIQKELEENMYVGISTNQPGSKSIIDRVTTARSDEKPGVLGYCANITKNYNQFVGDFYYTAAYRPEFYSDLREIFRICVQRFTENRGKPPKSVVFYYTGVSEGQFEAAYKHAMPLIRDGIRVGNGGIDIPLTVLAVQKMNNVRLFPKKEKYPSNGKDFEYNVPHGTVVDTTIVSPVFSEFYLVAHSALKGTGRVPRYTVLVDDNNFSMDVLQGFTHALSYEHQIVSRATSLPTPVYVAEGYALRGRDVFNAEYKTYGHDMPRDDSGALNLRSLSEKLNYLNTNLREFRVNA